jgi:phosphoglycolate phosphatase-like HAD superfamily hydrolase
LKKLIVFDLDGTLAESKASVDEEKKKIVSSLEHATESADLKPEQTWGDRIEDRGS